MKFIASAFLLATAQAAKIAAKSKAASKQFYMDSGANWDDLWSQFDSALTAVGDFNPQCVSDMTVADFAGDNCDDYVSFPGWCHNYDDASFVSGDACCVCGGGHVPEPEIIEGTCVSDLNVFDAWGDDCDDYALYPDWCHNYDDSNFVSGDACCVCGGGHVPEPENPMCENDMTVMDNFGDDCNDYTNNPGWCHIFDTDTFISGDACCICQDDGWVAPPAPEAPQDQCYSWNGQDWTGEAPANPAWTVCGHETCTECGSDFTQCYEFNGGPGEEVDCHSSDAQETHDDGTCTDVEGAHDWFGDECWEYALNTSWCHNYDDEFFVSGRDCCACGGGN